MFALDTSYAVTDKQLEQMRRFVLANIDQYLPTSKLALVRYGSKAVIDAPLSNDRDLLQSKLQLFTSDLQKKNMKISGERYIDQALLKIKNEIFTSPDSSNTPSRQVVLFATGASDPLKLDKLSSLVNEMKEKLGVTFVYIGLGDDIPTDDMKIISSGSGSGLKEPTNVDGAFLPSIYDDMFKAIHRNTGEFLNRRMICVYQVSGLPTYWRK